MSQHARLVEMLCLYTDDAFRASDEQLRMVSIRYVDRTDTVPRLIDTANKVRKRHDSVGVRLLQHPPAFNLYRKVLDTYHARLARILQCKKEIAQESALKQLWVAVHHAQRIAVRWEREPFRPANGEQEIVRVLSIATDAIDRYLFLFKVEDPYLLKEDVPEAYVT